MLSEKAAAIWMNTTTKSTQDQVHLFQVRAMFAFRTVCSMIVQVVQTAALLHRAAQALAECSSKKQHSRHARQQVDMEEEFSSLTLIMASVLFFARVALTVHHSIQRVMIHLGSMFTQKQRMMQRSRTKLMNQQLQEVRRKAQNHSMHYALRMATLYVHRLTYQTMNVSIVQH